MVGEKLDKLQEELDRSQDMAKSLRESGDGSPGMRRICRVLLLPVNMPWR